MLEEAPLYERFHQIIEKATAITAPALNQNLRDIGEKIQNDGFRPLSEANKSLNRSGG